jgi:hypothetical protein
MREKGEGKCEDLNGADDRQILTAAPKVRELMGR